MRLKAILFEKSAHMIAREWKQLVVDKSDRRGGAFDVEQEDRLLVFRNSNRHKKHGSSSERGLIPKWTLSRATLNIRGPEAHRLKPFVHSTLSVVGRPAATILK